LEADSIAREVAKALRMPGGAATSKVRVVVERGRGRLEEGHERDKRTSCHRVMEEARFYDRRPGEVMRLDSPLKSDRCTLVFAAIGDDKVPVICQSCA
jgi:hypothetical protein